MWVSSTMRLFAIVLASCAAAAFANNPTSCKDARDNHGKSTDGVVTLDLKVDAVTIDADDFHATKGLDMLHPSFFNDEYKTKNYKTLATTVNAAANVWCHKMGAAANASGAGLSALAYLEVDPANNSATWSAGTTAYTTSFSKLRFDEATQLIYTADCEAPRLLPSTSVPRARVCARVCAWRVFARVCA